MFQTPAAAAAAAAAAASRRRSVAPAKPPRNTAPAARGRARPAAVTSASSRVARRMVAAAPKEKTPPKRGRGRPSMASKTRKTPVVKDKKAPEKRNSSELDDALFKDVHVVIEKLRRRRSPVARAVEPDEVFDRLEEVRRSPLRVQIVCEDILKESKKEEEEDKQEVEKTPVAAVAASSKKARASAIKRNTRSSRKAAPPSPVKGELQERTFFRCSIFYSISSSRLCPRHRACPALPEEDPGPAVDGPRGCRLRPPCQRLLRHPSGRQPHGHAQKQPPRPRQAAHGG